MIIILLCAFNEEDNLGPMFEDLLSLPLPEGARLLVVNDGSTDATGKIIDAYARKLVVTRIDHHGNLGLGRALATGFSAVAECITDNDVLITMDADNTHPLELIPEMVRAVRGGNEIVIASRFRSGGTESGVPANRRLLSAGARFVLGILFQLEGVRDYTSGYRAFSGRLIRRIADRYGSAFITEPGFTATFEILLKSGRLASKISELPLALKYDRKRGKSKMRVASTVSRYLRLILLHLLGFDKSLHS